MYSARMSFLALFLFCCCCHVCQGIRWISLQHSHLKWNAVPYPDHNSRGVRSGLKSPCTIAKRRYGLAKLQTKLCKASTEAMPYVQSAATIAANTCKSVFQDRRWNCSSVDRAPYLTPDLLRATREQAYVYAISSAALTYTLARACSSGAFHYCSCSHPPGEPPQGNFKWGGCGDNIKWGSHFAKRFVDNVEKYNSRRLPDKGVENVEERRMARLRGYVAAVNLHNNKVGRRVISESLATQCKCHGVSGSCSVKTCWRAVPEMKEVGVRLLRSYTNAKEVQKGYLLVNNDIPEVRGRKSFYEQLVFLTKSPDYCTKDERLGSYGTVGRKCNVTSNGTDSCRQLCCGRGYRTVVEEKIERCQCKYYYCCYVKCNTCRTLTQRYECS